MHGSMPEQWAPSDYSRLLPVPASTDHKGSRGRLLIVGGAPGLTGAVCLAASAALRAGCGYVVVAVPSSSMQVVEAKLTAPVKLAISDGGSGELDACAASEVVRAAEHADAVVLGPGLGRAPSTLKVARELITNLQIPLLIDADALFAIGDDLGIVADRTFPAILTPHSGEAARLLGCSRAEVDADREGAAHALAVGTATVLLKGPGSLVSGRERMVLNPTGGPELATLGTGDVLAGIVGALLAQGIPPFEAAALGAYLHGAAGAAAAEQLTSVCCTAEDVVAYLPEAVRPLIGGGAHALWRDV